MLEFLQSLQPQNIPADVSPTLFYIAMGAAVLVVGIAKAGFGGGVGVLAVPLMAMAVGPEQMLGIMLPLLIACDIFSNLHHLGQWDWRLLRWLVPGAVLGVAAGTVVLWRLGTLPPAAFNQIMNLTVGGICLFIVLVQVLRMVGARIPILPAHPLSSLAVGGVAGGVSTLNHSAGPIVQIYMLQLKVPKRLCVGSMLLYFLLINTAKLPTFIALDYINAQSLRDSIWFIPLIPVGTLLGAWMNKRVPERPFAAIMYIGAAGAAGHLIFKGLQ